MNQNISALQRNQYYMDASANNVANINSSELNNPNKNKESYTKAETNLTKEITDQIVIENVASANVQAIKTQDKMIGSLLDIKA